MKKQIPYQEQKSCHDNACFVCPHCFSYLNVGNQIIFKVITKEKTQGLVILTNKPGNFESTVGPGIMKIEGDLYTFFCPVCNHSLHDNKMNDKLVKIFMIGQDKIMNEVFFSSVFGEESTYVIRQGKVKFFGKHYQEYLNQIEQYKDYYDSKM